MTADMEGWRVEEGQLRTQLCQLAVKIPKRRNTMSGFVDVLELLARLSHAVLDVCEAYWAKQHPSVC